MATWKKLIVSGSNISQLNNDSGFITSTGAGIVSSSAQIDHDQTTNFSADEHFTQAQITTVGTVTSGDVSAILPAGTISGSSQVVLEDADKTGFTGASSITTLGTVTSGNVDAILPAGTISGSAQVDYLNLSNIPSGILSASVEGDAQGQIKLNGVNVDTNNLGTGDSPQFANLTLTGDLTVQGDTINANVTNLDIEDRFILLNSGSATIGDSGIVFGGSNGTAQQGAAVIWDASYNSNDGRLAIVNDMASSATGDQTPNYHVAGVYEGSEANAATAQADHVGNIRVEGGDIFIYV